MGENPNSRRPGSVVYVLRSTSPRVLVAQESGQQLPTALRLDGDGFVWILLGDKEEGPYLGLKMVLDIFGLREEDLVRMKKL